jgi:hypothetical protein
MMRWVEMWQIWWRREVHTSFGERNQKDGDDLEGLGVDMNISLKIVTKWDGRMWIGFVCLGIGTSGRLL